MTGIHMTVFCTWSSRTVEVIECKKKILFLLMLNILLRLRRWMSVWIERGIIYTINIMIEFYIEFVVSAAKPSFVILFLPFHIKEQNHFFQSRALWLSNLTRCEIITRNRIHGYQIQSTRGKGAIISSKKPLKRNCCWLKEHKTKYVVYWLRKKYFV
jgi:hypothetical protein